MLAAGDTVETLMADYPWLEREDVQACLAFARRSVANERIEPLRVETTCRSRPDAYSAAWRRKRGTEPVPFVA
jgi:Protein of unknown function (DUF433)